MLDQLFNSIAAAIRTEGETTSQMTANEFASNIIALITKKDLIGKYPIEFSGLEGTTVTATQNSNIVSGTIDSTGKLTLWVEGAGDWSISATHSTYGTVTRSINIPGNVDVRLDVNFQKISGITPLTTARAYHAAATNNVVVLAGGHIGSGCTNTAESYNASLTHGLLSNIAIAVYHLTGVSINSLVMIGGGTTGPTNQAAMNCYNGSGCTRLDDLSVARSYMDAAVIPGLYALFGGGFTGSSQRSNVVDAYTGTGTHEIPEGLLSQARSHLAAGSANNTIVFGGGVNISVLNNVDSYDKTITHSTLTGLSVARQDLTGKGVGTNIFFAGGLTTSGNSNICDVYNSSLTRLSAPPMVVGRKQLASAAASGNIFMVAGGVEITSSSAIVDTWNSELTHSQAGSLSEVRNSLKGATIDNYTLFTGGHTGSAYSTAVDVYKKV